jgi:hypothetical protein
MRGSPRGGGRAKAEPPRASSLEIKTLFLPEKSRIDFHIKIRIPIDPDQLFNRDRDRDHKLKIANRFQNQNRDPILISKSRIDFRTKIGSRFIAPSVLSLFKPVFNRGSISK